MARDAKKAAEQINKYIGQEIALWSGEKIQIKYRKVPHSGNQTALFGKIDSLGYRLKRFGEFSTGTEFAEFVPKE